MAKRNRKAAKRKKRLSKPKYQVFVSHATADKWIATTFCEKIDAIGASSFRDDRTVLSGVLGLNCLSVCARKDIAEAFLSINVRS